MSELLKVCQNSISSKDDLRSSEKLESACFFKLQVKSLQLPINDINENSNTILKRVFIFLSNCA